MIKKTIKIPLFWKIYITVVTIVLIGFVVLWSILWTALKKYEQSRPEYAMDKVTEQIQLQDTGDFTKYVHTGENAYEGSEALDEAGDITSRRKSPKRCSMYDAMFELYKIKAFLKNPNLKVTLLLIDMEEYKLLNGWSYDKKRGSVRYDRIPVGIRKVIELDCPQDYMQFVPDGLENNFTSADFANAAHIDRQTAASVLAMLNYMEQVKRVGKTGNAYIYDIEEHY